MNESNYRSIVQFVARDPDALSGSSVARFMARIIRPVGVVSVGLADLDGALGDLKQWNGQVVPVDLFLDLTRAVVQFDWAYFFLYARSPSSDLVPDPRTAMTEADVTVRLVDDEYFYVYAHQESLLEDLRRVYPDAECSTEDLETLVIPS